MSRYGIEESFEETDYLVAVPVTVGKVLDEPITNEVIHFVFRQVNGRWIVVGN